MTVRTTKRRFSLKFSIDQTAHNVPGGERERTEKNVKECDSVYVGDVYFGVF